MTKYHLFAGANYYPCSGLMDYVGSYATPEDAVAEGEKRITLPRHDDWYEVIYQDHTGSLVAHTRNWRR